MKFVFFSENSLKRSCVRLERLVAAYLPIDTRDNVKCHNALAKTLGFYDAANYSKNIIKFHRSGAIATHSINHWNDELAGKLENASTQQLFLNGVSGPVALHQKTKDYPDLLAEIFGFDSYDDYCSAQATSDQPNYDLRLDEDLTERACYARWQFQLDLLIRHLTKRGVPGVTCENLRYLHIKWRPTAKSPQIGLINSDKRISFRNRGLHVKGYTTLRALTSTSTQPNALEIEAIELGLRISEGEETKKYQTLIARLIPLLFQDSGSVEIGLIHAQNLLGPCCNNGHALSKFLLAKLLLTHSKDENKKRAENLLTAVWDSLEKMEKVFDLHSQACDYAQFAGEFYLKSESEVLQKRGKSLLEAATLLDLIEMPLDLTYIKQFTAPNITAADSQSALSELIGRLPESKQLLVKMGYRSVLDGPAFFGSDQ